MSAVLGNDLLDDLDRIEKMFQDRMKSIFEKYNHAFEEDIVVNIVNFTYDSAYGPVPWDFKLHAKYERKKIHKKKTHDFTNETFIIDDSFYDSPDDYPNVTYLLQKKSSDNCERTFIYGGKSKTIDFDQTPLVQCKLSCSVENMSSFAKLSPVMKGVSCPSGHEQSLIPYTGSHKSSKTFPISSLEEDSISVQLRSFISRHSKDCSFEDSRVFAQNVDQPNDTSLVHFGEMVQFDLGENNLAHFYPSMVECIRRLWELPGKKRAADNIVQYYKRQIWNQHKKMLIKKKSTSKPTKESLHLHILCDYKSYKDLQWCSHTLDKLKHFKHNSDDDTFALNSSIVGPVSILDRSPSKQTKAEICEIGSVCIKEQNGQLSNISCSADKRLAGSLIPLRRKQNYNCKSTPKTVNAILDKTYSCQDKTKMNGVNYFSSLKNLKPFFKVADAIPRGSPFFAYPVLQSIAKPIDTLRSIMNSYATPVDGSFITQEDICELESSCVNQTSRHISDTFTLAKVNDKTPQKCSTSICNVTARTTILDEMVTPQNQSKVSVSPLKQNTTQLSKIGTLQERGFSRSSALHSPGKHNVTLKCNMDSEINNVGSSDVKKHNNPILNHTYTVDNKKSFSAFTEIKGAKRDLKSLCSVNNRLCLDKTVNYQNNLKMDAVNSSLSRELVKLTHFEHPRARRNSYSSFPVAHKRKSDDLFDYVYQKEMQDHSSQTHLSSTTKVQSSDMVCSLVNSPGSLRAKRRASNVSLAVFKRTKSIDETFIQSTNSRHHSLQETRDSFPQPNLSHVSVQSSKL